MLAARLHRLDAADLRVEDVDPPRPRSGETLVRVTAASVAHLDRTIASGSFATHPPLPYIPGTDGAGLVVESGSMEPGASVRIRGGGVGVARDGLWAEQAVVPDAALHHVPADADPALVATFYSPAATAHVALHEVGDVQPGERVAVTGASGAVGSLVVQLAMRAGAEVVALVGSARKRDAVPAGAQVVVGRGATAAAGVSEPVDLLVDTVGGGGLVDLLSAVRPGGRVALVGYTAGTELTVSLPALLQTDVRLLPVNLLRWAEVAAREAPPLLAALSDGTLQLAIEEFALTQAGEALAHLASGEARGRVALRPAAA